MSNPCPRCKGSGRCQNPRCRNALSEAALEPTCNECCDGSCKECGGYGDLAEYEDYRWRIERYE